MSLAGRAGLNIAFKALGELSRFAWAILLILVARHLGGEAFGRISFAYSFTTLFVMVMDAGLNIFIIREVARNRAEAPRYLGSLLALKLLSAPLVFVMIAAAITVSGYPIEVIAVVLLFAGIGLVRGFLDLYGALFSGMEVMSRDAALKHLYQGGLFLSGGMALLLGCGPVGVSAGLLIGSLLVLAIGSGMIRAAIPSVRLLWDPACWRALLRGALPVGLTTAFISLYNQSDIVLLSYLGQGERAVGWYAAAGKILMMLQLIPMVVVSGVYPVFSDLARGEIGALSQAYRGTVKLLLMIAIPVTIVVAGVAEPVLRLIYGEGFGPATVPLRLLAWSIPFVYLGYVLVNILVSSDHLAWAALATGSAAAVNVVVNLLCIPVFGIAGSALAAIATQIVLVAVAGIAVEWTVTRSGWIEIASKPLMAGLAMLAAVVLIGPAGRAIAIPVGLCAYLMVLALTGAMREEEFMAVKRLWDRNAPNGVFNR